MAIITPSSAKWETNFAMKLTALGAGTLIFAISSGFLMSGLLYGAPPAGNAWIVWTVMAVSLLFLVTLWGIDALLIKMKLIYVFFFLSVIAVILPLLPKLSIFHLLAALVLLLWVVFAYWKIQKDMQLLVKPKAGRILRRGIKTMTGGLVILITVFCFFSPKIAGNESMLLPRSVFDAAFAPLSKIIQIFIPSFRTDMTVDQVISEIAGGGAFDQVVANSPELKNASPKQLEEMKNKFLTEYQGQIVAQGEEQLSKQFGIPLQGKGGEKISDIFYDLAMAQFRNLPPTVKTIFDVLLALGIYFALKIVSVPFVWACQIVSAILLKVLIMTGFASTKKEMVERETVAL